MKLDFIPLDRLSIDPANMRAKGRDPDVSDILPSVRKRGVLQSLLVRPGAEDGHFRITAGRRRFTAANLVVREGGLARPLPCGILEEDDDADAIEASMLENLARVAPDEVSQWEAFVKLVKAGRRVEEIAIDFAFEPRTVKRILALGSLLPKIRSLYRAGDIDQQTVRHLTLASKSQQTAWLALWSDPDNHCPTGYRLKDWLFGGDAIKTAHALFDVETSGLAIITDLFGEEPMFADADAFWTQQMAAVEARKAGYLEDGWSDVVILETGTRFATWNHSHETKRKGGRVYIEVHQTGEIGFHEGYVTDREASARAKGEKAGAPEKAKKPEVTSALNAYIDFHRHAAVRAELARHGGVALRALAAHVITGLDLFRVEQQSYSHAKDAVQQSVEKSHAEALFAERRRAVIDLLGLDPKKTSVTFRHGGSSQFAPIFARLLELPDAIVLEVVAIVMGETLSAGSEAVEAIGQHLEVDLKAVWKPDAAFWGLVRDKEVLGKIVAEVAGGEVAAANAGEKTAVLKAIVTDHLDGTNGRAQVAAWTPKWMAFPPAAYTTRGGVGSVAANDRLLHFLALAAEEEARRADADDEGEAESRAGAEPESLDGGGDRVAAADPDDDGDGDGDGDGGAGEEAGDAAAPTPADTGDAAREPLAA